MRYELHKNPRESTKRGQHSVQQRQDTQFSQAFMEHPLIQTIFGATKHTLFLKRQIMQSTYSDHKNH